MLLRHLIEVAHLHTTRSTFRHKSSCKEGAKPDWGREAEFCFHSNWLLVGKVGDGMGYYLLCYTLIWYEIETFLPSIGGMVWYVLLICLLACLLAWAPHRFVS